MGHPLKKEHVIKDKYKDIYHSLRLIGPFDDKVYESLKGKPVKKEDKKKNFGSNK